MVDGHKVEGSWRAHQVPVSDSATNEKDLKLVEDWLRSYRPEELFDVDGRLIPELQDLAPSGPRRVLDVGGRRGSTLLVRVEDVVLRLHGRMARVSAV